MPRFTLPFVFVTLSRRAARQESTIPHENDLAQRVFLNESSIVLPSTGTGVEHSLPLVAAFDPDTACAVPHVESERHVLVVLEQVDFTRSRCRRITANRTLTRD